MSSSLDFELIHHNTPTKAVMLFHGLTGSPFEMKKYGQMFYNAGYDVYCYCLPGHGDHPQPLKTVRWQDWISFSQDKYSSLRAKYKDFFLSGLCLGAVISIKLAQTNYDVTGVLALSTTLYLDGWTIPWYSFLMPLALNTIVRYHYTFPEREPYGIKNETIRKKISGLMSQNTVALDNYPLTCVYELLGLSKNTRQNIHQLIVPILLIHSKEDDLTSIKSSKFVYDNALSQVKEYVELSDSYHHVLYDNERKFVYDTVINFSEKLLSKDICEVCV